MRVRLALNLKGGGASSIAPASLSGDARFDLADTLSGAVLCRRVI